MEVTLEDFLAGVGMTVDDPACKRNKRDTSIRREYDKALRFAMVTYHFYTFFAAPGRWVGSGTRKPRFLIVLTGKGNSMFDIYVG
jgi:hypothetical protein